MNSDKARDDGLAISPDEARPLQIPSALAARQVKMGEKKERRNAAGARRIRIMRIIQSVLSAVLSLAIAIFQGRVYGTYQNTKSVNGAWPPIPNVVPTLLLFSVAIAALVFDGCMLVAYMMPNHKYMKWVVLVGGGAHYIVTSTKTVSYAISAVISKTSNDYGVATGLNSDLWSWTCSDLPPDMAALIHSDSNCNTQVWPTPLPLL
jgi:hypothetical protein